MRRKTLFASLLPYCLGGAGAAGAAVAGILRAEMSAPLAWLVALLCVAGAAAVCALLVVARIRPALVDLQRAADRLSSGAPSDRLIVPDETELAAPIEAFQKMADRQRERIDAILQKQQELEAVLTSMVEGVLAVDSEERVISINRAAARLLDVNYEQIPGRNLHEVVRHLELRRFVASALSGRQPVERDLTLRNARESVLQAHGTALRDAQGSAIGAVIVLNDVSRLRRLETMRRDFAANVSHELKTPITSIKGFVETLLDGAMHNPQDTERFLNIIARQADRLDAIIEDLLSLATIETEGESGDIPLVESNLHEVLELAVLDCAAKAAERGVSVELRCPVELRSRINAPLLQQAVVNLLDNAIKYSDAGKRVWVEGFSGGVDVAIAVRDEGCGVASEHVPRLFERFYRVDKARSRKQGGTGLGLAIVKHIVLAHRGEATVESKPGAGSVFTIRLPLP